MKPSWLLLALLGAARIGLADDDGIHRCIGDNGEPTFSDQKCAPSESSNSPASQSAAQALPSVGDVTHTQTCPTSPEDLRERVATAFAARSPLGLSGLFLWDGLGPSSAIEPLRELAVLIAQPVVSIDIETPANEAATDPNYVLSSRPPTNALVALVIRTAAETENQVPYEAISRFALSERQGCWWLLLGD